MGDKPIIRIAVPGESAEEFMQNAAKQFRGDFFVAIDQAVGKYVRIEAPFLQGDVGIRGDAIAMPAVRNGRKGLVVRLVKLDPDSLGIPIPESKPIEVYEPEEETDEFDPTPTMASPVSAAVAKSIRATANASDRAQPVKLAKADELDPEAREAVDEFTSNSAATTKASGVPADLAKQLAELEDKEPRATPAIVRRVVTPQSGIPKVGAKDDSKPTPTKAEQDATDDSALDRTFDVDHDAPTTVAPARAEAAAREVELAERAASSSPESTPAPTSTSAPKSRVQFLVMCLLLAMVGAAAIALLKGWV